MLIINYLIIIALIIAGILLLSIIKLSRHLLSLELEDFLIDYIELAERMYNNYHTFVDQKNLNLDNVDTDIIRFLYNKGRLDAALDIWEKTYEINKKILKEK